MRIRLYAKIIIWYMLSILINLLDSVSLMTLES